MKIKTALLLLIFSGLAFSQSKIEIKNAWVRPAAKGTNSALFFTIQNNGAKADTLIDASSKVSDDVMIHETYSKGKDMMGMRMLKFVAVPAHEEIKFKPQGLHVMVMDLKENLKLGQTKEFSLVFKKAGTIKVRAKVKDMPPMKGM
ncbi:MAG: copper chaperone PCu(A)C [Bacteroidetes bacterium]|nr:copper chaperone PCu(A)C [Bacteroidota bacterium]MCL6100726.1 copper chaperone PCu(A)C [Bacteroidota bacterium]